jgi:hypothetical protein
MSDQALTVERKIDRDLTDTMPVGGTGVAVENFGQALELAKLMAASGSAVPKHLRGQPGACIGIVYDALRLRMSPFALARASFFVNDQLAYMASMFMSVVYTSPLLKARPTTRFEGEGPDRRCIVAGQFVDGEVREYRSPRFADIGPKNSPLWKTDPDQQQHYYSMRAFARKWMPVVVMGFVDVDELRDAAMVDISPRAEQPRAARPAPKTLDELATQISAAALDTPADADGSGTTAGGSHPDATSTLEAAVPAAEPLEGEDSSAADRSDWAPVAEMKAHAISVLLKTATNISIPVERRQANLEEARDAFPDLPPDFVERCIDQAKLVATGKIKADKARAYLAGF